MKYPLMTAMAVAAATLVGSALVAGAQESYPTRPIRVIVPEVVGSAADLMSRIIAHRFLRPWPVDRFHETNRTGRDGI